MEFEIVIKHGNYTVIKYEKQYIGTEYVVARNFNADEFSWDSASDNYHYSFESAMAALLRALGSDLVKSREQIRMEDKYGIGYWRLREIAEKAMDYVADSEEGIEYALDTMEMERNELDYFGIKED